MEYKKESSHQQDLQLLRLPLHANWLLETKTALNLWICTCCAEIKVCTSALAAISRVWQSTAWLWSEGATGLGPKLQEYNKISEMFQWFFCSLFRRTSTASAQHSLQSRSMQLSTTSRLQVPTAETLSSSAICTRHENTYKWANSIIHISTYIIGQM